MRARFSIIFFFVAIILIAMSLISRQSYEKEMYKSYLENHKDEFVESVNRKWRQELIKNGKLDYDAFVFMLGKDQQIEFYPQKRTRGSQWKVYSQLDLIEKERFLKNIFKEKGSWDRARAIEKWFELKGEVPKINLSDYEKTLVSTEAKIAFDLIFDQIKKGINWGALDGKPFIDIVLIRKLAKNEVELVVPQSKDLLKEMVIPIGYRISENPFTLEPISEFVPSSVTRSWEIFQLVFGIMILIVSIGLYLLDLRSRKRDAIKKVTFLNQLVHEVKTPITGIRLNADLLEKYGYDEKILVALLRSSSRLHEFFEDIVLINKNDHKVSVSYLDELKWEQYLADLCGEFGKKVIFENKVFGDIYIDRVRVRIIVRNLLKNAVRYGGGGSCLIERDNKELCFTIKDNGLGVCAEDSKKIFGEFFRGRNASPDGLGIGLSIVNNLASDMGAVVKLENPGQKNAIFTFKVNC